MYLTSLRIRNFRSCYDTELALKPDVTVLVGENNSGKSNVITALRLALTPASGRRTRYFDATDLSVGREGESIAIDMTFDGLTLYQRGHYITALDTGTMLAHYTVTFAIDDARPSRSRPTFFAGPAAGPDVEPLKRDQLAHLYLEPLRDAQRELDSSRSGRLATIIEYLTSPEEREQFVSAANLQLQQIEDQEVVVRVQKNVKEHLGRLSEPVRGQDVGVRFSEYRLRQLAAALRLKMADAGVSLAGIAESGLGYANLLYIASVLLQLQNANESELTVLLVEEPEAHLHPQLQSVLLEYLQEQAEESCKADDAGPAGRIQVLVTTHSPHIASKVSPSHVVVLKSAAIVATDDVDDPPSPDLDAADAAEQPDPSEMAPHAAHLVGTRAVAVGALGLSEDEDRKIGQYLDATKASLLFGTRVILVEGVSEAILLPVLARRLFAGEDDASVRHRRALAGLSIVNIGSVDFEPYVRLLLTQLNGTSILDRLVVVTDSDPKLPNSPDTEEEQEEDPVELGNPMTADEASDSEQEAVDAVGEVAEGAPIAGRVRRLLELESGPFDGRLVVCRSEYTLEADLLALEANRDALGRAFLAQRPRSTLKWETIVEGENPAEALYRALRKNDKLVSKGQFAHDIAAEVAGGAPFECPAYLVKAISTSLGLDAGADADPD